MKTAKKMSPKLKKFRRFAAGEKIVTYYPLFGGRYAGHSAQHEQVAQEIQHRQLELVAEFNEKKVGLKELRKAIETARETGSILVFSKLAYLARNLKFLKVLAAEAPDIQFVALDDEKRFNSATFPAFLGQARDVWHEKRTRIKDAMAEAKANGAKFGAARPGHFNRKNEHLRGWRVAIVEAAKVRKKQDADAYMLIVPIIRELLDKGLSYRGIANELNERGHRTTKGTEFVAPTVFRIYKRQGGRHGGARAKGVGRQAVHAATNN
jgi:DNA invertase Pin-like site-specific DNA recombinase